jgi:hypothetical protein
MPIPLTVRAGLTPAALIKGVGAPAWVGRDNLGVPALMTLDGAGNRGWHNGVAYSTEAAFLAGIGGSKSGEGRTIGPYVAPDAVELVSNGDFSAGLGGWAALGAALASVVNGELVLDGNGVTNASVASPAMAVVVGKAYQYKAMYRRGTAANAALVLASPSAGLSPSVILGNNNTTANVTNTGGFAAEGSAHYVALRIPATTPTGTVIADNISVKEASPMVGWVPGKAALVVDFVAPASVPALTVLATMEDGAGSASRNKIRLYLDTDGHLKIGVTTGGALRSTTDLGAVTLGAAGRVHFTSANNRVFAALGTALPSLITGFSTEGVYALYLGRSFSGETWTGTLSKAVLHAKELAPDRAIVANGDSYVAGVSGASVVGGIIAAGRAACVGIGAGGSALAAQLGFLRANPGLANAVYLHWDGDANGYGTTAADLALYAQMLALLGHQRFIIIPPCVRANSADKAAPTVALAAALKAAYPANTYDAQAFLATLSDGSGGDLAAVAAGQIPPSCLQADATHLTVTAMNAAMANVRTTVLDANGW